MQTQDICEILWDDYIQVHEKSGFFSINRRSLADHIVSTAFEKGSMDNMAALVIPLQYTDVFETSIKETCNIEGSIDTSTHGLPKIMHRKSDNGAPSSGLVSMDFASKIMSKFNRLLVETKQTSLGCFHLFENLNDNSDYVFPARKDHDELNVLSHALLGPPDYLLEGRPPGTYDAQKFCWHFEMDTTDKGQCINHESFVKFLGLLESIPLDINGSNSSESYAFDTMEYRYILKKRFDRGSYGEVWLAHHWNCSGDDDSSSQMRRNTTCMFNDAHHDPYEHSKSGGANSSDEHNNSDSNDDDMVILKRIMVERGVAAYLSGLREKYFGEVFLNASMSLEAMGTSAMFPKEEDYEPHQFYAVKEVRHVMSYIWNAVHMSPSSSRILTGDSEEGLRHIARYIESFESPSKEIWLVFRNEGFSLSKLMYTTEEQEETIDNERFGRVNNVQVLHPSAWWYWLRTTDAGKEEMRSLIWQLLMALKSCHDRNITHRDIKPENMIVCYKDVQTGRCLRRMPIGEKHQHLQMRIIDFGSAIDEFTLKYLYGSGPTRSEQTSEYTSPEALLNANWFQASKSIVLKYDTWSVGVVMLELILGTPHVFQISSRTRALLDHHLEHWSDDTKELAYKLRSLMEMCILIPGSSPKHYKIGKTKAQAVWPASWKCSEEFFSNQIKSRDPLGLGFPNIWALRLVRQLLFWHPEDRLSVDEAMRHPYFRPHPRT
ncbi:putative inactive protein kinase [Acorus gramineus]|uniref:Inactive protein kinase n=1 Tax=Acorus gramineus TaxID=55184 RepID=A0AAV9AQD1_ACOGR|nr:putative inactive protein kinase [Acorus gramineus]